MRTAIVQITGAACRVVVAAAATPHGARVAELADQLAAQLARPLGLTEPDVDRLVTAARLHGAEAHDGAVGDGSLPSRCGELARRRHRARQLLAQGLPGIGPEELVELVAVLQRAAAGGPHVRGEPYDRLPARRRRSIDQVAALVQLACALDGGHDGAIAALDVEADPVTIRIRVVLARGGTAAEPGMDADVRVAAGASLGRRIEVVTGPQRPAHRRVATM